MMNEKEIKEALKKEADSYTIKTSASDILNKYNKNKVEEETKKKVKPWYLSRGFAYGASAFAILGITLGVTLGVIFGKSHNTDPINPTTPTGPTVIIAPSNNAILNQTSYEIMAGLSLSQSESGIQTSGLIKKTIMPRSDETAATDSELTTAVKKFEEYRPMALSLADMSEKNEYYTPIQSDRSDFIYALSLDDGYVLYYNDAFQETKDDDEVTTSYEAKLINSDKSEEKKVKIERTEERETGEVEIEIKTTMYDSDKDYVVIEQSTETEQGEKEKEYSITEYVNNVFVKEISFDFEQEGTSVEKEFEIKEGSTEYSFVFIGDIKEEKFTFMYEERTVVYQNGTYTCDGKTINI